MARSRWSNWPACAGWPGCLAGGARRIVLGVGGSASTDGGAGLLRALGARVLNARSEPAAREASGRPGEVTALDLAGLDPRFRSGGVTLALAADVGDPLAGPDGAAQVYGPQKGASQAEVARLDAGLRRWAAVVATAVGKDWSQAPGAGAAGGVARRGRTWPGGRWAAA